MDYLNIFLQMLQAKGLTDNTIRSYKTYILPYLAFLESLGITPEDSNWQIMRDFLDFIQKERNLSNRTVNMIISYLQFFQIYVLHKNWDSSQIPFRKFNTFLPFVPSRKQVRLFLDSIEDPKFHLAVSILYATGLRLDELCHLKCSDIIHSSGKIHVRQSKNHSDRYVPLPESLWDMILDYWHSFPVGQRPVEWLFTQQRSLSSPMNKQWLQAKIIRHREFLGMDKRLTAHSFRHAYATHSYENGMGLLTLSSFLGHRSINSTVIYVHLAASSGCNVPNPFEQLHGRVS